MASTALVFLALLCLAAFFSLACKMPAALAPLLSLCALAMWLSLAGTLNVLLFGGWLALAASFALLGLALWRRRAESPGRLLMDLLRNPAFALFALGGFCLLVYLGLRQPLFSQWDEFSFWGTAVKLTKLDGRLYTLASDVGWHRVSTQHPALVVLGWFFQLPARGFAAWKVYFSNNLLYLAAAASITGLLGRRHLKMLLPLAAAALLAPHFFSVYYRAVYPASAWISAYADLPSGALFGGALAVYFVGRWAHAGGEGRAAAALEKQPEPGRAGALQGLWQPMLVLAALALTKENNLPIVLVAAGIMAADTLLFLPRAPDSLPRRALAAAGVFAAPLAAFAGWKLYAGFIISASAPAVVQGTQYTGSGEAAGGIIATVAQLLGLAPRGERFSAVLALMGQYLAGEKISMLGGAVPQNYYEKLPLLGGALPTVALLLALFLAAALLAKGRCWRLRVLSAAGLSTAGWLGWQLSLLYAYTYVFTGPVANGLADYSRYMSSYYLGWFLLALVFLGQSLRRAAPQSLGQPLGQTAAVSLAMGMLLLLGALVPPGSSALDYSQRVYDPQRALAADAEAIRAEMQPGERVFYVGQGEDGGEWYQLLYHLLPQKLDYSLTGGASLVPPPPGLPRADLPEDGYTSLAELSSYLAAGNCPLVYIHKLDADFINAYGTLFGDALAAAKNTPCLYRRDENGMYQLLRSFPPP